MLLNLAFQNGRVIQRAAGMSAQRGMRQFTEARNHLAAPCTLMSAMLRGSTSLMDVCSGGTCDVRTRYSIMTARHVGDRIDQTYHNGHVMRLCGTTETTEAFAQEDEEEQEGGAHHE